MRSPGYDPADFISYRMTGTASRADVQRCIDLLATALEARRAGQATVALKERVAEAVAGLDLPEVYFPMGHGCLNDLESAAFDIALEWRSALGDQFIRDTLIALQTVLARDTARSSRGAAIVPLPLHRRSSLDLHAAGPLPAPRTHDHR